jgi:hypothetical protein
MNHPGENGSISEWHGMFSFSGYGRRLREQFGAASTRTTSCAMPWCGRRVKS